MKFPGSKLLHRSDLAIRPLNLDDLRSSSRSSGLTGLVEVAMPGALGLIFYYLGGEVNALFREGSVAYSGQAALPRLRAKVEAEGGTVSVFELPLDMAHLLRGITGRKRLREPVATPTVLADLLRRLEKIEHTGTLEVEVPAVGSGMVLLVRGRVSNTYWEAADGLTFEKGEGRQKLDDALVLGEAQLFLADFSRDVWKARHEAQGPITSRLEQRGQETAAPGEGVLTEETALRKQILDDLQAEVPGLLQAVIFDLMTGAVFVRTGRGAADLNVSPLAEQVPALTLYLRAQIEGLDEGDALEFLELSTERISTLVTLVAEAQEAIALLADRSQPTALMTAALARAARTYAARLRPLRRRTPA
jgi:hypothetical protein